MYEIFAKLLKERKLKAADVCRGTGLPSSLFSEWKRGKSNPKLDKLQKIADFFEVPISFFYKDDNNAINKTGIMLARIAKDKDLIKLIETYLTLKEEDKKSVNDLILFLQSKNQKE